jgi:hypothetical protein
MRLLALSEGVTQADYPVGMANAIHALMHRGLAEGRYHYEATITAKGKAYLAKLEKVEP